MATTSVCVHRASPSCFLPLWESLQDELVGLTQGSFKALSAMLGLEMCEILCAPFRYGDSVSSSSSLHNLWWPSKPDVLWSLATCCPLVTSKVLQGALPVVRGVLPVVSAVPGLQ